MINYSTYVTMAFIPRAAQGDFTITIVSCAIYICNFTVHFEVNQNMLWLTRVDLGK